MSTPAPDPVARVRAVFETIADDYDQSGVPFFAPTAQGLVDALDPRPGERALDIGCGRGAATILLARAVLPSGSLDAVDLSPAMVAHTRALLAAEGHAVRTAVMDAADPDLSAASYDVVASSLVLFFLSDPAAALERWVRLVAPGGRIGLTTFGEEHPVWTRLNALFRPWLPPAMLDPKLVDPEGPFTTDAGMENLLRDAGATEVRTVTRRLDVPWGDVEGWKTFSLSTGQRAMWSMVPAEERDGLEAEAAEILQDARDDDGRVVIWQDMRYTLGHAPGSVG
jgi:ubiquinone/menaquinone biosynthesis C-methylase UbiE